MGSFATGDPSLDELVGAEAKLLDGKVGRLGTLQNLVIIGGSAPETDAYRRVLSLRAITSKVNAILVYVPTLEGWHLLLRLAVAISRTTKFYALAVCAASIIDPRCKSTGPRSQAPTEVTAKVPIIAPSATMPIFNRDTFTPSLSERSY